MRAFVFGFLLIVAPAWAARQLPPKPILTPDEVSRAAAEAPVARIDLVLPANPLESEIILTNRFFNQPEEHRYGGLVTTASEGTWRIFSEAMVKKAKSLKLDAKSLSACLRSLNRGRNLQTALILAPEFNQLVLTDSMTKEQIIAAEKEHQAREDKAMRERQLHPEKYYDDSLAIVPVGAYLARHINGECWIIVCKWESITGNQVSSLGHIKVWALDSKTTRVVSFVTCD